MLAEKRRRKRKEKKGKRAFFRACCAAVGTYICRYVLSSPPFASGKVFFDPLPRLVVCTVAHVVIAQVKYLQTKVFFSFCFKRPE